MRINRIGRSTRTVLLPLELEEGFAVVSQAFARIGHVVHAEKPTSVSGRTRIGLQVVRIRATLVEEPGPSCEVQLEGLADDVWGGGAALGLRRLAKTMGKIIRARGEQASNE